jgi:hypothetical protein
MYGHFDGLIYFFNSFRTGQARNTVQKRMHQLESFASLCSLESLEALPSGVDGVVFVGCVWASWALVAWTNLAVYG